MKKRPIHVILENLQGVEPCGDGYKALCPAHHDTNPSLSICESEGRWVKMYCHAGCLYEDILKAMGISYNDLYTYSKKAKPKAKIIATYDYVDENGKLIFQVVRYEPKNFKQRRPGVKRKWIFNLQGVNRVLFNLPNLIEANTDDYIFVVEGEKDVETLKRNGLVATTCSGGANKWHLVDSSPLHGKKIIILPDNDKAGVNHAHKIAASLHDQVKELKILALPDLPEKGDVTDWFNSGGIKSDLLKLVDEAENFDSSTLESENSKDKILTLDPQDPYPTALTFIDSLFMKDGCRTLHYYAGSFYLFESNRYIEIETDQMNNILYNFLSTAITPYTDDDGNPKPFKPNTSKINDILNALRAIVLITKDKRPPLWLTEGNHPDPTVILPTKSLLLNLNTFESTPLTPAFFTMCSLDYEYKPESSPPEKWIEFLNSLWPDDPDAILLLQEWFGYCLTPDTRRHKMLLIVGPPRSGKGTISRILSALVGDGNVARPVLDAFGSTFGLSGLIGKTLAIISDARLGGQQNAIKERLLNISGEDPITIDRKYKDPMEYKLFCRIMMATNELPAFREDSSALPSRFLGLKINRSFLNKEDISLEEKLRTELPDILNWAIEGYRRLKKNDQFTIPQSSKNLQEELIKVFNPIAVFVEECCVVDNNEFVYCKMLYHEYVDWCNENKYTHHRSINHFGKSLQAYLPQIRVERDTALPTRPTIYYGIGLRNDHKEDDEF